MTSLFLMTRSMSFLSCRRADRFHFFVQRNSDLFKKKPVRVSFSSRMILIGEGITRRLTSIETTTATYN